MNILINIGGSGIKTADYSKDTIGSSLYIYQW